MIKKILLAVLLMGGLTFAQGTIYNVSKTVQDSLVTDISEIIDGTTAITPTFTYTDMSLRTVAVGDSALGRMFLNAADTTLYMGSGTDIIAIKDLIP